MKIISWNVNGIRALYKKGLLQFIQREQPDLICLQEAKAKPEQLESEQQNPAGMSGFWSCCRVKAGYSGVVTFSKDQPQSCLEGIGIEEFDQEGRVAVTDFGKFLVYNIYFPNGGMGPHRQDYKMRFLGALHKNLQAKLKTNPNIIVLGDYNIAPEEIDVFDPIRLSSISGFLPEEREWMKAFLDLGFVDSFRKFHLEERNRYSWWSYKEMGRISNRGWRIDHICVSSAMERALVSADIMEHVEGSDHCPVWADLQLNRL